MSSGLRAFLGALLGALITLAAHPISRPFILGTAYGMSVSRVRESIDHDTIELKPPRDLIGAALWLQLGFDKIATRHLLSPRERTSLIELAQAAAKRDSRNAFWKQALAALYLDEGQRDLALTSWLQASKSDGWKDYQSERLLSAQQSLESDTGALQAWQYAVAYYARSSASTICIERCGRALLGGLDYDSPRAQSIRYATLINGDMIRTGGRSNENSLHGANLVEVAAYPSNLTSTISPKRLWIGQNELLASLQRSGSADKVQRAKTAFAETDAWRALVFGDTDRPVIESLSYLSILTAQAPVAAVVTTIAGLMAWSLGMLTGRFFGGSPKFSMPAIALLAILIGAGVYLLSFNAAATLAVTLSVSFLLVGSNHVRDVDTPDLGPLFTFVMLCIAIASASSLAAFVFARSVPAMSLAPALDVPQSYYERPALAGLSAVFLSLVFIAGPLYALVHRLGTPTVVSLSLRRVGAIMAFGGLIMTVILAPLCVYFDRSLCDQLYQLVSNEPVYHLTR